MGANKPGRRFHTIFTRMRVPGKALVVEHMDGEGTIELPVRAPKPPKGAGPKL